MFKNAIIYRIATLAATLDQVEAGLQKEPFTECAATQKKSSGWVPPRGEAHGVLVESINGHWIMRFTTETKAVPADALRRDVDARAAAIEAETGRRPGKKERRELLDEAWLTLLPMAFARQASTWVWIDRQARLLLIDTASQARADEIATALVKALPGLALALLDTQTSPQAAMAHWLMEQEPPEGFSIDRECELKASDKSKAVVRYGHHPLDIAEVRDHIQGGKLPTKLAMRWDDRVSFVLTEPLQMKKIAFLKTVFEGRAQDDSGFDADVAIATGELAKLITGLVKALGGDTGGGL
jgi:recombination associated protein RdgC